MIRIATIFFLLFSFNSFAQIELGGEGSSTEEKTKKAEKKEEKKIDLLLDHEPTTEIFGGANWSVSNRKLIENPSIFGDSLGIRANEVALNTWSFGIGLRNRINQYLMWEGGIAYLRNGESYSFEDIDSSYSYQSTYTYVGMPLKLYFTYGNKVRLQVGGGLIPQMFVNFKQSSNWTNAQDESDSEEIKTKIGYNSFVVSAVANIGISYRFENNWGVYLMPEYRYQLGSSYLKTNKFKHYGSALGVSFGLSKSL